ncbi:MAG TPA: carboxypeptidase regulatory-like domain-containing protein, partial [Gammaproteobacteria bacterium]
MNRRTFVRCTAFRQLSALLLLSLSIGAAAQQPALTGRVTSSAEGPMEGVLVRAHREGSNKTVTVVTRADGSYSFPRERLEPGPYTVSVRAVKYVLPARHESVDITANAAAQLDLALRDADSLELALQMTDPEWFGSFPLDDRTKWELFRDCSRCHTMRRPSMSTYDAEELAWVMMRMVYSAGSSPMRFQLPANATPHWGRAEGGEPSGQQRRQAEAIASINLRQGSWSYELKTLPRPTGKETEVIYTTWDLPATARPHDTRIAADGSIWFNHFNDNAIGRLDPKTGQVKEWRWPYRAREGSFAPTGARTLMGPDARGRWYIGNQAQSGVVVFDPATEQFEFHDPP